MGFFSNLFSGTSPHQKLEELYKKLSYKKIPALPKETEEVEKILENYKTIPSVLVPKEYMESLRDHLMFGHIVMLWWLSKTKRKQIPQYFLYDYGLDFEKELIFLRNNNYIDANNNLTKKGLEFLNAHKNIVRKHKAKKLINPDGSIKEYLYEDTEATKYIDNFVSNGDYLEDQRLGASFEKKKDYDNAIKAYKSAIKNAKLDGYIPPNPFMRLAIIYRKLKDRDSEIAILKEGIALTKYPSAKTTHNKLVERLDKLLSN